MKEKGILPLLSAYVSLRSSISINLSFHTCKVATIVRMSAWSGCSEDRRPHHTGARAAVGAHTSEFPGGGRCAASSSVPPARFGPCAQRAARVLQTQGARVGGLSSRILQHSSRRLLTEMPGRRARKSAQQSPTRAPADPEVECAIQFRRIGDKLNFRQKLLNLISKLFRSGT
ncbi:phorbol-12-myristate-13-acetate-induced protein 1 [Mesoplodon densirostris]|uniref:phorbol-12-myristate-13-acetate-induced protein 1 n=1 Tax=Mesoplodon densirostris TaxID=48708 RepID=UPI0028DD3D09|nr:phorbol-12-myristate-13-acetate-induced protein 1 [Mesoplodon densirostris]